MYKAVIVLTVAMLLLLGCAGGDVTKSAQPAVVTSMPSGADVYADGKKLGNTPLTHDLYEAFPAGWSNSSYQAQGELVVKKSGCKSFSLKVSDYILSQPIHAALDCNVSIQATKSVQNEALLKSVEERLKSLSALYDKGLISKDEYTQTRKRILEGL